MTAQPSQTNQSQQADRFGLVGTVLDRKFRVDRLVAEGGFGVVYFGNHLTLDKPIAIKVLKTPQEFNDAARQEFNDKFQLEAKMIARISHPNIVQVLDFGVSQMPSGVSAPWMVLEWLTGQTLEAELLARRNQGGRAPQEVLALMRPAFEAMAYAHDEGIAHRDIKPANMMIVRTRRGGTLRLLDFGIAKAMEEGEQAGTGHTRTRTAMNAFSPMYAAPEQIGGARSGPWTDVHALGLIVTEMLTDLPPYEGEDVTTIYGAILSQQRPTPAARRLDAGSWERVLRKALALKPDERFRTAGEFLQALEANVPAAIGRAPGAPVGGSSAAYEATSISGLAPIPSPSLTTLRGAVTNTQNQPVMAPPASRRGPILAIAGFAAVGVVAAILAVKLLGGSGSTTPTGPTTQGPTNGPGGGTAAGPGSTGPGALTPPPVNGGAGRVPPTLPPVVPTHTLPPTVATPPGTAVPPTLVARPPGPNPTVATPPVVTPPTTLNTPPVVNPAGATGTASPPVVNPPVVNPPTGSGATTGPAVATPPVVSGPPQVTNERPRDRDRNRPRPNYNPRGGGSPVISQPQPVQPARPSLGGGGRPTGGTIDLE